MCIKIKVGIVGIGRAGWGMHCSELDKYKDYYEITGACDLIQERINMMEQRYNCRGWTDFNQFLKESDCELVSIATRSPDHTMHALEALECGKYVFLEKPIALNYADALLLKKADIKFPGKLYFRHNCRFDAAFQHIREIIGSGILGEVYEIKLRRHNYQRRADWQTIKECGGGMLNNWGPHLIDHALQLLESPVKEVWGDMKTIAAAGDAEDHLKIILKGENKRIADIEISGGVAIPGPFYEIYGTKGTIVCETGEDIRIKHLDSRYAQSDISAKRETPPISSSFGNAEPLKWKRQTIMVEPTKACKTSDIWKYLYDAMRNNIPFPVKTDEAIEVVRISMIVKKQSCCC